MIQFAQRSLKHFLAGCGQRKGAGRRGGCVAFKGDQEIFDLRKRGRHLKNF